MLIGKLKYIIGGFILIVIFIIIVVSSSSNNSQNTEGISTTNITSSFTHTSTSIVPYYNAEFIPGGKTAVNTDYVVFGLNDLKITADVKDALSFSIPPYLSKLQEPNAETVYIQLDIKSVKYISSTNFSFNFYTDSPEGYFNYSVTPAANNQSSTSIKPIGGGWL